MNTEAEAQARLLAYYENRLTLLAGRIDALKNLQRPATAPRGHTLAGNLKRARNEVADLQEKTRRLRETIASD